jgi:hypothetical protein
MNDYKSRITPDDICDRQLSPTEVWVYPSNMKGQAVSVYQLLAELRYGASFGKAWGYQSKKGFGASYAIPTVDKGMRDKLPLPRIRHFIDKFVDEARTNPGKRYYVVGFDYCGLGSWPVWAIAPQFAPCVELSNVYLPLRIWESMNEEVQ